MLKGQEESARIIHVKNIVRRSHIELVTSPGGSCRQRRGRAATTTPAPPRPAHPPAAPAPPPAAPAPTTAVRRPPLGRRRPDGGGALAGASSGDACGTARPTHHHDWKNPAPAERGGERWRMRAGTGGGGGGGHGRLGCSIGVGGGREVS